MTSPCVSRCTCRGPTTNLQRSAIVDDQRSQKRRSRDIGKLETQEGWIYPKFMEQVCPGLPDWTALEKPECIQALATPETTPNGRFLDYPADWGSRAATILADNNMPYTAVPAGSEGALVAELELGGRQEAAGHDVLGARFCAGPE